MKTLKTFFTTALVACIVSFVIAADTLQVKNDTAKVTKDTTVANSQALIESGKQYYKQAICITCHTIGKGKLVGPDLKDIHKKREEKWLLSWIKSSQTMVKSGDTIANKLFRENNQVMMPDLPLNEEQIKAVLAYIKAESENPTVETPIQATALSDTTTVADSQPTSPIILFAEYFTLGLCLFLLVVAIRLQRTIKKLSAQIADENAVNDNWW